MSKYKQGYYQLKNPEKYIGNKDEIIYRSSWERRFFQYCDMNPNVVQWNSEEIVIPYYYPVDQKMHRYFIDLAMAVKQKDGSVKTYLVEIKPYKEVIKPKEPKRKTRKAIDNYMKALLTWEKNKAKWTAAKDFAKKNNSEFVILTEKELFGK